VSHVVVLRAMTVCADRAAIVREHLAVYIPHGVQRLVPWMVAEHLIRGCLRAGQPNLLAVLAVLGEDSRL
jgi:hypothetical protein